MTKGVSNINNLKGENKMISQTKYAIQKLIKAGFKRSEFQVRTPKNKYGEWGEATIYILNTLKGLWFIPELIQVRLNVQVYFIQNTDITKYSFIKVDDSYHSSKNGNLEVFDIN